MGFEFTYRDLKKDMLSDKALALLSEFALIWHRRTGELINLESDDALITVFRNSKRSNDRRLRSIYLHLRAELSIKIECSLGRGDAMLADQVLSQVSLGRKCLFHGDVLVG